MFYSQVILARKGPLGKIWLAAHFDKRLTKNQIFSTDITSSVYSVLNPTSPLALRVSGHLMLGIVRIYARKVKYLMSDCTEAMWKIKLAFRPGNVDIDPNMASAVNIDDARYFGNISFENEFPDLENTAFPQFLLSGYDAAATTDTLTIEEQQADRRFGIEADTFGLNDYSIVAASPLLGSQMAALPPSSGSRRNRFGTSERKDSASDSSPRGRVSDIELMRNERSHSLLSQQRVSLSTLDGRASAAGMNALMGFEDDVPAFEDAGQFEAGSFGMDGMDGMDGRSSLAISGMSEEEGKGLDLNAGLHEEQQRPIDESEEAFTVQQEGHLDVDAVAREQDSATSVIDATTKAIGIPAKRKRHRVLIDERIELPNRLIKQRMEDLGPVLRRNPNELLPFQVSLASAIPPSSSQPAANIESLDVRMACPSSVRGFCAELRELFSMSTNQTAMPFPRRNDSAAAAAVADAEIARAGPLMERNPGHHADRLSYLDTAPSQHDLDTAAGATETGADGSYHFHAGDDVGTDGGLLSRYSEGAASRFPSVTAEEAVGWENVPYQQDEFIAPSASSFLASSALGDALEPAEEQKWLGSSPTAARVSKSGADPHDFYRPHSSISKLLEETFRSTAVTVGAEELESGAPEESHRRRADQLESLLKGSILSQQKAQVPFSELTAGVSRRMAAASFLETLQLKTWGRIQLVQTEPFSEIQISLPVM